MTHASPAPDEQEFWLFIQDAPLPAAEELQESMFRLDGCFRLNLSGAPENAPDHVLEGEYLDEAGERYSGTEESFGFPEQGNQGKLMFLRLRS